MSVPKQRKTKSRRNQRRGNIFIKAPVFTICPKCGKQVLPHIVCFNCGYYKGNEVIDVLKKLNKKEKKQKEREINAKQAEAKSDKESLSWEGMSKE